MKPYRYMKTWEKEEFLSNLCWGVFAGLLIIGLFIEFVICF